MYQLGVITAFALWGWSFVMLRPISENFIVWSERRLDINAAVIWISWTLLFMCPEQLFLLATSLSILQRPQTGAYEHQWAAATILMLSVVIVHLAVLEFLERANRQVAK